MTENKEPTLEQVKFLGEMRGMRIYNYSLSQKQINALYRLELINLQPWWVRLWLSLKEVWEVIK
jgi:hypothetical protein